jgi:hypothetical protein
MTGRRAPAALGLVVVGIGIGLAAGFTISFLRARRGVGSSGYVAPAPAIGQQAVPDASVDLRQAVVAASA